MISHRQFLRNIRKLALALVLGALAIVYLDYLDIRVLTPRKGTAPANSFDNEPEVFFEGLESEENESEIQTGFKAGIDTEAIFPTKHNESGIQLERACRIPKLHPFHPSIVKHTKALPPEVSCGPHPKFPLLFKTDLESSLIQLVEPKTRGYFNCCYSSFTREYSDWNVDVSRTCTPITKNITVIPKEIELIQVSCQNLTPHPQTKSHAKQVVDVFGFIRLKLLAGGTSGIFNLSSSSSPTKSAPVTQNLNGVVKKVNVAILAIDAVSHMNLMRTMPLSFQFLTNNLSAIGLQGYVKVADNNFPNVVPMLTGLHVDELPTKGNCWKDDSEFFDECPFIWKDYSRAGYVTAYGEDAVRKTAFNYLKSGFRKVPTDIYYNILTRRHDKLTANGGLSEDAMLCYGPRLSFQVLLEQSQKLAVAMAQDTGNKRYFEFNWSTTLTHDYLTAGKLGDKFLLEYLKWFRDKGYLENTVLILLSDHGIRWGGIRGTLQGGIEERMPFLYFVFPHLFKQGYSEAIRNFLINKRRLTTPFDLHETIKDLISLSTLTPDQLHIRTLENNLDSKNPAGKLPRGISLFLKVPLRRTCEDAGISEMWCLCYASRNVVAFQSSSLVKEAAGHVVSFINAQFLRPFPQCSSLKLKQIVGARVVLLNRSNNDDALVRAMAAIRDLNDPQLNTTEITYDLSLKVKPGDDIFEAKVTHHMNGTWYVRPDMSRTTLYSSASHCVTGYKTKLFCHCKDKLGNATGNRERTEINLTFLIVCPSLMFVLLLLLHVNCD